MRFDTLSLKSVNFYKQLSKALFTFVFFHFYCSLLTHRLRTGSALRSPFCDHCTYYYVWVGKRGTETKIESEITHSLVCVVPFFLFATVLLWFLLLPFFFQFCLLSNLLQTQKCTHKQLHPDIYCVCTQTGIPGGWDTDKDTHQYSLVWAQSWITGNPYSGSVPLCVFVETNVSVCECFHFLNFFVSVTAVSIWTNTNTSTSPTPTHSEDEHHPTPLLTFAIKFKCQHKHLHSL